MDGTAANPGAHDSVVLARFLLSAASSGGVDARRLIRDARIPGWALAGEQSVFPSRYSARLWELLEHALEDPHLPLTIASRHQAGELDLFDYLFATALTVRAGFQATQDFLHLVTTNSRFRMEAGDNGDVRCSYWHVEPGGRGEELCLQFSIAYFCGRATISAGQSVVPSHVAFAFPAPRSHQMLAETLGTRRIDFGAPVTTITFRPSQLDLPLRTADPVLARILHRYAATLQPAPVATWREHFRRLLGEAIDRGSPSLDVVAGRLAVSRRTLQRQLAGHGTTWRTELDAVRRDRALAARQGPGAGTARLASQLGYADARSASRALCRWRDQEQ